MKLSQLQSTEDIISIPAGKGMLNSEETTWIDQFYLLNNSKYKFLVDEYEKEKRRNRRLKSMQVFPSREQWVPSSQSLEQSNHKLLHGPKPGITLVKRVQLRATSTGRLITYSSASFEDGKRSRISSSYVCINHKHHTKVPQFGHIKRIFSHEFGDQSTLFAEADVFDSAQFDAELKMWFTQLHPKANHLELFPLKVFSEPLAIAIDEKNSFIWFLNYQHNM